MSIGDSENLSSIRGQKPYAGVQKPHFSHASNVTTLFFGVWKRFTLHFLPVEHRNLFKLL